MDTTNLPKTRSKAKAQGAKYYFTGEPCKHGHVAPRKTKGACVECLKVEWAEALTKRAGYYAEYNKSSAGIKAKQDYYARNKVDVIARAQARTVAQKNTYKKKYKVANPDLYKELVSVRRRRFRDATPPWLSAKQKLEIRFHYRLAIALSRSTKIPHAVDHIIPLQGESVCGLHVPWNMEVITQEENLKKSNKVLDTPEK
jgi:5-methylcytosine-specific restriction endonuclease McrA